MDVILGGPRAGERRKDDAVREGHSTDFERSEESRGFGERRHLSREACVAGESNLSGDWSEAGNWWLGSDISIDLPLFILPVGFRKDMSDMAN